MCFRNPTKETSNWFREKCYEHADNELLKREMLEALGTILFECSNFFSSEVEPIYADQGLIYAVTSYGSEDVILVTDDDYPNLVLPEWCSCDLFLKELNYAHTCFGWR